MFHMRKSNTDILRRVHFVKTSRSLEHERDDKVAAHTTLHAYGLFQECADWNSTSRPKTSLNWI